MVAKGENNDTIPYNSELSTFIPLFLKRPTFSVCSQLNNGTKKDFKLLNPATSKSFEASGFSAYGQLTIRRLMDDEALDMYLADIRRLAELMGLRPKAAEPLVKCVFATGLLSDVSSHV